MDIFMIYVAMNASRWSGLSCVIETCTVTTLEMHGSSLSTVSISLILKAAFRSGSHDTSHAARLTLFQGSKQWRCSGPRRRVGGL